MRTNGTAIKFSERYLPKQSGQSLVPVGLGIVPVQGKYAVSRTEGRGRSFCQSRWFSEQDECRGTQVIKFYFASIKMLKLEFDWGRGIMEQYHL